MRFIATALVFFFLATCSRTPQIEQTGLADWSRIVGDQRGEVAVVLVWATWCRTCLDLLPEFVALEQSETYGDVAFLTVTLDEHDNASAMADALALVQERNAAFPHYAFRTEIERAMHHLGIEDVPTALVYDQGGEVRYRLTGDPFDNEISIGDVEDAIESLR